MKNLFTLLLFGLFAAPSFSFAQVPPEYSITFDAGDTIWQHYVTIDTVNFHHNQWQVGRPQKAVFDSALSPLNAIVTDTLYPYAPGDTSAFTITFPGRITGSFPIPFVIGVSYYYKLDMDSSSYATVDYSPDSGRTWIDLRDSSISGISYVHDTTGTTWMYGWVGVSGMGTPFFDNDSIMLRFMFVAGSDTTGKPGWMIDNLDLMYGSESVSLLGKDQLLSTFPNPANNECTIKYTGIAQGGVCADIYDMAGRLRQSVTLTGKETTMSTAGLSPGLYECRVSSNGMVIANKKLVIVR